MSQCIQLGDVNIAVVRKDIKNVHLSVYPPSGKVRISAPLDMDIDTVRVFAISKLAWVRRQQSKQRAQERETPREYVDRESHYVWGRRYLLKLVEADSAASVTLTHRYMILTVRPGTGRAAKDALVAGWYRQQVHAAALAILPKWNSMLGVEPDRLFVRHMKTKWGSCNPQRRFIRLNTELAKKPKECLEYILAHELAHLRVPTHSERFIALMDRHMPNWQIHRAALNQLPVRHEEWAFWKR
jgi:predicted metal-dependent hydrolase